MRLTVSSSNLSIERYALEAVQNAIETVLMDEAGGFSVAEVDPELGDIAIEYVIDADDIRYR